MRERGVVARFVSAGIVEVSLEPSEACGRCGACHRDQAGSASIEAVDAFGAKQGDTVEIEISTQGVVAASFVVYLLPVVFLIAGYGIGSMTAAFAPLPFSGEAAGIAGAVLFFAVSFIVIRWYDRGVSRRGTLRAAVTKVLSTD
jgi:sigma-E factor negative regulatory protein RseC